MGSEEWSQAGENYKLNTLMQQDPTIATLYQDTLYLIRTEKEQDQQKIIDVHARFDYLKDPDNREGRIPSEKYDVQDSDEYEEN